jgi:hypothetical protein
MVSEPAPCAVPSHNEALFVTGARQKPKTKSAPVCIPGHAMPSGGHACFMLASSTALRVWCDMEMGHIMKYGRHALSLCAFSRQVFVCRPIPNDKLRPGPPLHWL